MALPKILVFGHSHMGALLAAARFEAANGGPPFEIVPYQFLRRDRPHIVNIAGKWRYDPGHQQDIRRLIDREDPALIVGMMQGDQAMSAGLIMPEPPFEFHFPGEQQDSGGEPQIVPFDLLFEACESEYALVSELLGEIAPAIRVPAVALSPPPPVGDPEFIAAHRLDHAGIAEHVRQRGLPSARWRHRVWKLHTMALRAVYERHGFRYVEPPPQAFDADGCLAEQFRSDVFHANGRYGRLLLRRLQSCLASGG